MSRAVLRAILLACIIGLCLYSQREYGRRHSSIREINEQPERFENVSFRSEGSVKNVRIGPQTRFTLVVMGDRIDAIYPKQVKLKDGDHVIVFGVLHMKQGYLEVTKIHVYRKIPRLYALSVAGMAVVLFLFLRDWELRHLEWRRKNA